MGLDEASFVFDQTSAAMRACLPLPDGLRALAAESPRRSQRVLLNELAGRLESGEPLAEVLARLSPEMGPVLRAAQAQVANPAAGNTGISLPALIEWTSIAMRRRRDLDRQLIVALTYPILIAFAAGWILLGILLLIAPFLRGMENMWGIEFPAVTRVLLAISNFGDSLGLTQVILVMPFVLIPAFLILAWLGLNSPWLRGIFCELPIVGPLFYDAAIINFCGLLARLVRTQTPLADAIELAGKGSGSWRMAWGAAELASDARRGLLTTEICTSVGLPPPVGVALQDAESPESLADSLEGLAELYAHRLETNSRIALMIVEPIVFVGIVLGFLFVVAGLFAPMIKLLDSLA